MKRTFAIILCLLLLMCGCRPAPAADIAATTLPVYQFTALLCDGTGLTVTRLVTESVSCLHDYSLNVSQVKAIESAQVVVISGAGLEGFMDDILCNAPAIIDSSCEIPLLECHDHDAQTHDHHHHEADSHIWLSPANAKRMATNICDGLTTQFPEYAATFSANLTELHGQLDRLAVYAQTQLSDLPCREMVTFHDGFSYLAEAFDLTILEAIEEESGSEASAKELIGIIDTVRSHHLPAVFTEINGSVSAADIISAETGAKVCPLDMAMGGNDYFEAMYHNIDTIKEALG